MNSLRAQHGFVIALALPWVASFFSTLIGWLFRKSIVGFVIVTSIYVLIEFLTPLLLRLAGSYFNFSIPNFFASFSPAMWFFMAALKVDLGVKLVIAAYATRFLIRRIPFIG